MNINQAKDNELFGFEYIYDKYCSLVYGISLQICCLNKQEAEELLTHVFKRIHHQNISQKNYPGNSITVVRIVIKTARELYPLKFNSDFTLKQFENTPLIHHLIFWQKNLQDYCKEQSITQQYGMQIIRKEFDIIRNPATRK